RGFEDVAVDRGVGQRGAGGRGRERVDPHDLVDDVRVAAVAGGIGHDPADHVAAVGMGDHDQPGDPLGVDEGRQLPGQAAGGAAVPHVLVEVAVDDHVVGRVGQAVADVVDHR